MFVFIKASSLSLSLLHALKMVLIFASHPIPILYNVFFFPLAYSLVLCVPSSRDLANSFSLSLTFTQQPTTTFTFHSVYFYFHFYGLYSFIILISSLPFFFPLKRHSLSDCWLSRENFTLLILIVRGLIFNFNFYSGLFLFLLLSDSLHGLKLFCFSTMNSLFYLSF